jgi:hypothetical protein
MLAKPPWTQREFDQLMLGIWLGLLLGATLVWVCRV